MPQSERPAPHNYTDHRAYLRSMIAYQKTVNPKFSYRYFARRAGFASPNFLKKVADGERGLSIDSMAKFAKGFELSETESNDFETLVLLSTATSDDERNRYFARLRRGKSPTSAVAKLQHWQFDVYSKWYALVIREMALLPDFRPNPKYIASRLRTKLTLSDIKSALKLLEHLKLLEKNAEGKVQATQTTLQTPGRFFSLAARNFQRSMLKISARALDGLPTNDRNISSLTLNLTRQQYDHVCRRIHELHLELLDLGAAQKPDTGANTYHIGFQVVPLTKDGAS